MTLCFEKTMVVSVVRPVVPAVFLLIAHEVLPTFSAYLVSMFVSGSSTMSASRYKKVRLVISVYYALPHRLVIRLIL